MWWPKDPKLVSDNILAFLAKLLIHSSSDICVVPQKLDYKPCSELWWGSRCQTDSGRISRLRFMFSHLSPSVNRKTHSGCNGTILVFVQRLLWKRVYKGVYCYMTNPTHLFVPITVMYILLLLFYHLLYTCCLPGTGLSPLNVLLITCILKIILSSLYEEFLRPSIPAQVGKAVVAFLFWGAFPSWTGTPQLSV